MESPFPDVCPDCGANAWRLSVAPGEVGACVECGYTHTADE